jgi:hypothetical protein
MDLLLSFRLFPLIVITDVSSMLAKHAENRRPGIFAPHQGRLAEPTEENVAACKAGTFTRDLCQLDEAEYPMNPQHFCLADKLHQSNLSNEEDLLRRVGFVKQLSGKVNTQVQEQFFQEIGRNAYYLTQLTPEHYLFALRLIIHFHNIDINVKQRRGICRAAFSGNCAVRVQYGDVATIQPHVSCNFLNMNSNLVSFTF